MRKANSPEVPHWIAPELLRAFANEDTDAHRLATIPGGWVERYGADILVSHAGAAEGERLAADARAWLDTSDIRWTRLWLRRLVAGGGEQQAPRLLTGPEPAPGEGVATETGLRYGLDFPAGYSAGLFLDQRANRRALEALRPRHVLNCFAYTCSFSVAAARAGAQTLSVDLAKRALQRGRENLERNGLDPAAGHRFIADDVFAVLPRLARRGERFDAAVLDPPTFSRGAKGKVFRVDRDLDHLVRLVLDVTAPGGHVLVSVNRSDITPEILREHVEYVLHEAGRHARLQPGALLPDFPPEALPATLWLHLA